MVFVLSSLEESLMSESAWETSPLGTDALPTRVATKCFLELDYNLGSCYSQNQSSITKFLAPGVL